VVHHTFSSLDQLVEATAGWDLDWRQLDRGRLEAALLHAASDSATFERVAFNRGFSQRGSSPSGSLTLGLIEKNVEEIGWCRKMVSTEELLVFSPGGDNDCVSRPGFCGHLMSYTEDYLERTAADLELPLNLGLYREGGLALQIDSQEADGLRGVLRRLDRAIIKGPGEAETTWIRSELETEIPVRLVQLLATRPPKTQTLVDGFRARAARRGRDYIDVHAAEPPTIESVCRAAGASWRVLNYAFREIFGVTPKQYLQATRLDGVRKELHGKGPSAKIADIANHWGFWHMGQFARDYRRQFGELPSETLNSRRQ
jgi:AraC-like DNA-binding protein